MAFLESVFPLNAYERQRGEFELEMVCERMVCNFVCNKLLNDINDVFTFFLGAIIDLTMRLIPIKFSTLKEGHLIIGKELI